MFFLNGTGSLDYYYINSFSGDSTLLNDAIASLSFAQGIGTLNFNRISSVSDFLNLLSDFSNVEVEVLICGRSDVVSSFSCSSLEGLGALCGSLESLTIYFGTNVSDWSILSSCSNLTYLYVYASGISDLSFVSSISELVTLNLNGNSITKLHPLQNLTNLTILNLKNNAIYDTAEDDDGNLYNNLQILIDLYNNGSLRTLYISGNKITEDTTTNSYYKTLLSLDWTASDF